MVAQMIDNVKLCLTVMTAVRAGALHLKQTESEVKVLEKHVGYWQG